MTKWFMTDEIQLDEIKMNDFGHLGSNECLCLELIDLWFQNIFSLAAFASLFGFRAAALHKCLLYFISDIVDWI